MVHPRKLLFYSRLNALDMIFQDVNDQLLSLFVLLTLKMIFIKAEVGPVLEILLEILFTLIM